MYLMLCSDYISYEFIADCRTNYDYSSTEIKDDMMCAGDEGLGPCGVRTKDSDVYQLADSI